MRFCRKLAGSPTKTDFARKLGMKDGDHYIGAENDVASKKPSLDLLERAAHQIDLEFSDFIQQPPARKHKVSRKHQRLLNLCLELLESGGEAELWIEGNIVTFHKAYIRLR